jgi:hypothetical protein
MNINTDGVTTLVKLDNPVVHVTAYDGFNVVSWEPVRDAANYDVWRLDTQSSSQVRIGSTVTAASPLKAVDNVTDSGEKLANGRAYKYIVIAKPNPARYLSGAGYGEITDAHNDLYSGRGEATVTARVPDPATYKVPKASDIKYRVDPDGYLYVSWNQPANARADIGYFPGGYPADAVLDFDAFTSGTNFTTTALFSATGPGYLYPKNAVTAVFPVIGGKATIAIKTEYFDGSTIYAADRPAKIDITLDQYNLDLNWTDVPGSSPAAPALTATHIYNTATTGTVQLSWSRIYGDENVYSSTSYSTSASNKVTYNVYKREIPIYDDYAGLDGYVISGGDSWTKVNFTILDPSNGYASDIIYAVETGNIAPTLSSWQYIVFASASRSGKTSHSYPLTALLERTLPVEATITSASIAYGGTAIPNSKDYTNQIDVDNLADGVTYKLYRGERKPILYIRDSGTGYYKWLAPDEIDEYELTAYGAEPIRTWEGKLVTGDTGGAIFDKDILAHKNYIYKLVSLIPGDTATGDTLLGNGYTAAVEHDSTAYAPTPYTSLDLSVFTIDRVPSSAASAQTNDAARGSIRATLGNNGGYTKDMVVTLYYHRGTATYPSNDITGWTRIGDFDRNTQPGFVTDEGNDFMPIVHQFDDPVYGESYSFKAVAYLDGKAMPNLDKSAYDIFGTPADIAEGIVTRALTRPSVTTWGSPALTFTSGEQIKAVSGEFLHGIVINVRIIRTVPVADMTNYWTVPDATIRTAGTSYEAPITLSSRPSPDDGLGGAKDDYTVQYKYTWETWESDAKTLQNINNY